MSRKKRSVALQVVCYFLLAMAMIFVIIFSIAQNYQIRNVPNMSIMLNGVNLDEINGHDKDVRYYGNNVLIEDNGVLSKYDDVEIKGHGNTSWLIDKKSYRLKLSGVNDLLGIGRERKWGLISNGTDATFLRNDLAQHIAQIISGDNPIRGEFVNLTVDGIELGLYYLTKMVEIGKRTIDLRDDMGILVELDNAYCESGARWSLTKTLGDCIVLKDVVVDENEETAMKQFMDDYGSFERAVVQGDYEKAMELADMESWAEYYLLGEFTANPDMYVTSTFIYKDGRNDVIHAGIGWDFDAAFGNRRWGDWMDDYYSPNETMPRMKYLFDEKDSQQLGNGGECRYKTDDEHKEISQLMCYLVDMPEFRDLVKNVYKKKLARQRNEVLQYLSRRAEYIYDSALRDEKIWGNNDFEDEVKYLEWWVEQRFEYFETIFGDKILPMPSSGMI